MFCRFKEKLINTNTRKAIRGRFRDIFYEGLGPYADEVVMGKIWATSDTLLLIPETLFNVNKLSTSDGSQRLTHVQLVEATQREIRMIEWLKENAHSLPPYIGTFNSFEFFRASIVAKETERTYRRTGARYFLENKPYLFSFETGFKRTSAFFFFVCWFPCLYAFIMRMRRKSG